MFGHIKMLHTLIGMGSAAFVAVVPYPAKVTHIFLQWTKKLLFFYFFLKTLKVVGTGKGQCIAASRNDYRV